MTLNFRARLDEIGSLASSKRARALESFVADLFRSHHYTAIVDSGVARPRQTDVLAGLGTEWYLVECKWRKAPAHVGDVDSLRARLKRVEPGVVGLLVSMSGFTTEAIAAVRAVRDQPVLLLSGDELAGVSEQWRMTLPRLLATKRAVLLRDGKVSIDEASERSPKLAIPSYPTPSRSYARLDGSVMPWLESEGEFGLFTYAHRLEDIDWNPHSGAGVALDVPVDPVEHRDLPGVLGVLAEHGWVSEYACWSIQQSQTNWYGLGQSSLIEALGKWDERAIHHSEEIVYVDSCDLGFYTITANISASPERQVSYLELSFQLEGVPLDTQPLVHLARALGEHEGLRFRPLTSKSLNRIWFRDEPVLGLEPLAYQLVASPFGDEERNLVAGFAALNPFRNHDDAGEAVGVPEGLELLGRPEYLVCDLRHYHAFDRGPDSYVLDSVEFAWTSGALVCRAIADFKWPDEG